MILEHRMCESHQFIHTRKKNYVHCNNYGGTIFNSTNGSGLTLLNKMSCACANSLSIRDW